MDIIRGLTRLAFSLCFIDMMCCLGRGYHGNPEYSRRLKANWKGLKELTLESLYEEIKEGSGETLQRKLNIKSLGVVRRTGPVQRRSGAANIFS